MWQVAGGGGGGVDVRAGVVCNEVMNDREV